MSPEKFMLLFYGSEWHEYSDKTYMQAASAGRFTYNPLWKMIEKFCEVKSLGLPVDTQCGNKRFIGIKLSQQDYRTLIEPILNELKSLGSENNVLDYFIKLEKKQFLTTLEKKIINTYWTAKAIFSTVPSLKSICKNECEKLGLSKEEQEKIIFEEMKREDEPHIPPDLRTDLPPILHPDSTCTIS